MRISWFWTYGQRSFWIALLLLEKKSLQFKIISQFSKFKQIINKLYSKDILLFLRFFFVFELVIITQYRQIKLKRKVPSQSKKISSRIAQLRKKFNSKIIIIFNFYKLKIIFNVTHIKFVVLLTSSYSWFSQHNDFLPAKHSLRNMIQQIVLKANWNELALSCDTFISVHSFFN